MRRVIGISGSTRRPSNSRALVSAILAGVQEHSPVQGTVYDIVDAGPGLGSAYTREALSSEARRILDAIEEGDALIVASPVYKGSYTGLFKHLFDFVAPDALANRPVVLGATGGGPRHALVVEHQLRPLFAFFSAHCMPTAVYASDGEFVAAQPTEPALRRRIEVAAGQLAAALPRADLAVSMR